MSLRNFREYLSEILNMKMFKYNDLMDKDEGVNFYVSTMLSRTQSIFEIKGLPDSICTHYYYHDIIRLSKEFEGYKSKAKEAYFCNKWFDILAACILQLAHRYGINTFKYQ